MPIVIACQLPGRACLLASPATRLSMRLAAPSRGPTVVAADAAFLSNAVSIDTAASADETHAFNSS